MTRSLCQEVASFFWAILYINALMFTYKNSIILHSVVRNFRENVEEVLQLRRDM